MKLKEKLELKIELVCKDNFKHLEDLYRLLGLFSEEVYGSKKVNLHRFIDGHYAIYLMYDGFNVIGFSSFCYNDYYGLREPTIGNDYVYILSKYRCSKAFYLFSLQAGAVIEDNSLNLEHYFASEDSNRCIDRIKGEKVYTVYEYQRSDVLSEYYRIKEVYEKIKSKAR